MFKEFFKFFRDGEGRQQSVDHPHLERFDGGEETYLSFLFDEIRPRVRRRIEEHPDTDPVLEISTGMMLVLFPDYFTEPDGPLADSLTPRINENRQPPAPPPAAAQPPAPPAADDLDEDFREQVGDEADDNQGGGDAESDDESAGNRATESAAVVDTDDAEDGDIGGESTPEEGKTNDDEQPEEAAQPEEAGLDGEDSEVEITTSEDLDIVEVQESDALFAESSESAGDDESKERTVEYDEPPAGFVSGVDETDEFEPPPVYRSESSRSLWPIELHDPTVLQGSRVLLAAFLDNDRLPPRQQLTVAELITGAEMWVHVLAGAPDIERRIKRIARMVEGKFSQNRFSHARLLLRLLPANRETRVNNDRQLFYEDMIYRFGIRGADEELVPESEEVGEAFEDVEFDDDEVIRAAFETLEQRTGVEMHLYTRDPDDIQRWRELFEPEMASGADAQVLGMIPPRCWRRIDGEQARTVADLLDEHLVEPMLRRYVLSHFKTAYFVLRTVGDTGLESYLDSFFDWADEQLDVDAVGLLPEIHRRISTEGEMVEPVFDEMYDRHFAQPVSELVDELRDRDLSELFDGAVEAMFLAGPSQADEGAYNFGGFVLDAYLEFDYPEPDFPYRLHRLM